MVTETPFLHTELLCYGRLTPEDRGCQLPLFFSRVLLRHGSFIPEDAGRRKDMRDYFMPYSKGCVVSIRFGCMFGLTN